VNRKRRKKLEAAFEKISDAMEILDDAISEEQESLDNLPDNFKYGERGEEMQGYLEMLNEARDSLDDANSVIEQI
jgi:hypothetical protein